MMARDRVDDLLDEFATVTGAAARPEPAARAVRIRSGLPLATLTGVIVVLGLATALGLFGGRPGPVEVAGASPSVTTSIGPLERSPVATPSPSVTPEPTVGPCDPLRLSARITSWDGAAGSRIATVELVQHGPDPCLLEARARPQLVAGDGAVLIDGANPRTTTVLTLEAGATVTTLVSAANYCGPAPQAPVSVAFVLGDGRRLVAAPATLSDTSVPPCNGPGQPGAIEMHPWAR